MYSVLSATVLQLLQLFRSVAVTGRTKSWAMMDRWKMDGRMAWSVAWRGGTSMAISPTTSRPQREALTFLGTADGRSSQISGTAFLITITSPAKFHLLSLSIITVTMFAARQAFSQAQRRAFSVSARQVRRPCSISAAPRHCACFFLRFGYVNTCHST
jgi:hypothetical protein